MIGSYVSIFILGSQLVVTVADNVPKLDVRPSCRAAALVPPGNLNSCLKDEQVAQTILSGSWARFAGGDRATCTQEASIGGLPSYVALLTCLQMARDARKLPDKRL
jgi:hypothetical protein